jgi:16S rRNA (cytosine1402-N4)-methyltransferase
MPSQAPVIPDFGHEPVLLRELVSLLPVGPGQVYIDCTLGRGGHASVFGEKLGESGLLVGLDLDESNLSFASERLGKLPCRARFFHASFADLSEVARQADISQANVILADLGVSTNQLLDGRYGMSISVDGDLDMRLDRGRGVSAAEIVNRWPEARIADVLFDHADERFSRRIARKIGEERRLSPILSTARLAEIVRAAIGARRDPGGIDPATRTFQALRMEANSEVRNLERLLETAPGLLAVGSRLAVISFHSGEDRLVKQAFTRLETGGSFRVIGKKPIAPAEDEVARNPRSRSARLRVLERI